VSHRQEVRRANSADGLSIDEFSIPEVQEIPLKIKKQRACVKTAVKGFTPMLPGLPGSRGELQVDF